MMKAYFEFQDEPWSESKKFDIYFKDGYYYAEEIEPPCNDRRRDNRRKKQRACISTQGACKSKRKSCERVV